MYFKRLVLHHRELAGIIRRVAAVSAGLMAALAVFAPAAAAQAGLGLSPMRVEVKVTPGVQRSGSLTLANDTKAEARFRTEILDFYLDSEAVPQFEPDVPAESQYSCRQWFTFNPMEGTVPGSGDMLARYTMRVPQDAPPATYHCAVGFTSLPPIRKPQENGVGMNTQVRVVTAFYVTIGDSKPNGGLQQITLQKVANTASSGLRAVFKVENTGLTNLRGDGTVELLDASGKIIDTMDFPTAVILPRRTQMIPLLLKPKLADGEYSIRARVNLGTGEIQEASFGFRSPPAPIQ